MYLLLLLPPLLLLLILPLMLLFPLFLPSPVDRNLTLHHSLSPVLSDPSKGGFRETLERWLPAVDFPFIPREVGKGIFRRKTPLSMLSLRDMIFFFFFCFILISGLYFRLPSSISMSFWSASCCSSTISLKESSYEDSGMFWIISMSSFLPSTIACNRDLGDRG